MSKKNQLPDAKTIYLWNLLGNLAASGVSVLYLLIVTRLTAASVADQFSLLGTGRSASRYPIGFLWMVLLVLLMEFVLNHTKFGRYTIAIGSNKEAAALSGINVKFYHVMVYVVCGLFTGLAAIAYAAVTPTVQPGTGAGLEMDAIGGVFVGGVAATGGYGSVIGTFVGIFVIMLLKTGLPYVGLQANWQQIITGLVLIGAVLIDIVKEKKKAAM